MEMMSKDLELSGAFPNIGEPARRALTRAGYFRLEDLTKIKEEDLPNLHGVGPKAVRLLKQALEGAGLSFRKN